MDRKVCLVTGATSGLGAATARALAQKGLSVVVVGRNRDRCEQVAAEIAQTTGNEVEWLLADLSVQSQIRRLADEFTVRHDRLDVLVNNAGAIFLQRRMSADGIEMTLAVNHLAYFMLTCLLLDRLKASAPARIVSVASMAHEGVQLDVDDLNHGAGFPAYKRSKLANLVFTYELARRLAGSGVTANAVNPGLVRTNINANNGWVGRLSNALVHLRYRAASIGPAEGARSIVQLATADELAGISGQYFSGGSAVPSSPASRDLDTAKRLWLFSERLTACQCAAG
jgi:NAD(P)-dependent dehydrogenase (short-subunit alcohol dehydrogenase family)